MHILTFTVDICPKTMNKVHVGMIFIHILLSLLEGLEYLSLSINLDTILEVACTL